MIYETVKKLNFCLKRCILWRQKSDVTTELWAPYKYLIFKRDYLIIFEVVRYLIDFQEKFRLWILQIQSIMNSFRQKFVTIFLFGKEINRSP